MTNEQLHLEFLKAIQEKGYTDVLEFMSKEGSRDKKTMLTPEGKTITYWFTGIRPIHFYVQMEELDPVSLFQVPD